MMTAPLPMNRKLIDSLYVEAMVLADEARSYFDRNGREERDALPALHRVGFSCESLRVTTRLMHVIAWLLTRRAVDSGEISEGQASAPERRLGRAQGHDPETVTALPDAARMIIAATSDLYARVERLDRQLAHPMRAFSPAQGLMDRLQAAF
jgi:regulator of CtrA degradation